MPELIPIAYEGSEHLTALGSYSDGLFLACVSHAHRDAIPYWLAIVHTFTRDGVHRHTDVHPVPVGTPGPEAAESYEAAQAELTALLDALPGRADRDIAIRPFSVEQAGFTVGLIADPDGEYADLLPAGIRFSEPWIGDYST